MANGGNVYFTPPEFTALGGLGQGVQGFLNVRQMKKAEEEREKDREQREKEFNQNRAINAFQAHLRLGDTTGAARAAYLGGLTQDLAEPVKSAEELEADLYRRGLEDYDGLPDWQKRLFNVKHLGTLDPDLAILAAKTDIDWKGAQIENIDADTARQLIETNIAEQKYDDYNNLSDSIDRWITQYGGERYAPLIGAGPAAWDMVMADRDFRLREQATWQQMAESRANARRLTKEAEAAGATMDPTLRGIIVPRAQSLLSYSAMLGGEAPSVPATIAYLQNPDDPRISSTDRATLQAAERLESATAVSTAQAALSENADPETRQMLDIVRTMAGISEDAAIEFLNMEDENGVTNFEQIMTGAVVGLYGPEAVGRMKVDGFFRDKVFTTFDLSRDNSFGAQFINAIVAPQGDAPDVTEATVRTTIDQLVQSGEDPSDIFSDIDPESEWAETARSYLQEQYEVAGETPAGPGQTSGFEDMSDDELQAAFDEAVETRDNPTGTTRANTMRVKRDAIARARDLLAEGRRRGLNLSGN